MRTVLMSVAALGFLVSCADPAEPDLKRCEVFEAEKKFAEAIAACEAARLKGPASAAGMKAKAKLPLLERARDAEIAAAEAAESARLPKSPEDERAAKAKKLEDLRKLVDPERRKRLEELVKGAAKRQKKADCDPSDPLCGSVD